MKNFYPVIILTMATTVACNQSKFSGSQKVRKAADTKTETEVFDPTSPTDLYKEQGDGSNDSDLPKGGDGDTYTQNIELGCDSSQGRIIEIGGASGASLTLTKNDDTENSGKDDNDSTNDKPSQNDDGGDDDDPKGDDTPVTVIDEDPKTPEDAKYETSIKGKICPSTNTEEQKIKLLFVVDYSGSMGAHTTMKEYFESIGQTAPEVYSTEKATGNDPLIGDGEGVCGRLEAAKQILKQYENRSNVEVGFIPFASTVEADYLRPLRPLADFNTELGPELFCKYIMAEEKYEGQEGSRGAIKKITPTGIGLGQRPDMTNYQAAFEEAERMVKDTYGKKLVYFISDGQPTLTNDTPMFSLGFDLESVKEKSIQAGKNLRNNVPNLNLYGIILGEGNSEAEAILNEIAGGDGSDESYTTTIKDVNVFIDNPSDPDFFTIPEVTTELAPDTAKAILQVEPYEKKDIGLLKFEKLDDGTWEYETNPFFLMGLPGSTVDNVLTIKVEDSSGYPLESKVTIRYTRPNP